MQLKRPRLNLAGLGSSEFSPDEKEIDLKAGEIDLARGSYRDPVAFAQTARGQQANNILNNWNHEKKEISRARISQVVNTHRRN